MTCCCGTMRPESGSSYSWAGSGRPTGIVATWSTVYDEIIVGDLSAGGDLDETIIWDRNTGQWVLYSWVSIRR